MVPSIECLGRDGILDGYIHRWHLAFWLTVVQIEHMAVERDILIQTKLARAVVNHDVTYRITTERILTIPYMGITTAETHVANDDIMVSTWKDSPEIITPSPGAVCPAMVI